MVEQDHPVSLLDPACIGAERIMSPLELPPVSGQAGHRQVEQREIGRQLFRRVAFGIDGNEDGLKRRRIDTLFRHLVQRRRQQRQCHRADVGAIGVAEEQRNGRTGEIGIVTGRTGLIDKLESPVLEVAETEFHLPRLSLGEPENTGGGETESDCGHNGSAPAAPQLAAGRM